MTTKLNKKVTAKSRTKALLGNFKRCTVKDVHTHIKFIMDGEKIDEWYFLMGLMPNDKEKVSEFKGNDNEFAGGQFIGKITATSVYPYGPPNVEMLTPTGVFPLNNNNFCIDIGKYHKDNYPATLGMDGYTKMIWSGLMGWQEIGHGINLVLNGKKKQEQIEGIRSASKNSIKYNEKYNKEILELFKEAYPSSV